MNYHSVTFISYDTWIPNASPGSPCSFIALLAACSSKPSSSDNASQEAPLTGGFLRQQQAPSASPALYGDFATNPNAERFIDKMVKRTWLRPPRAAQPAGPNAAAGLGVAAHGLTGARRAERRLAALS